MGSERLSLCIPKGRRWIEDCKIKRERHTRRKRYRERERVSPCIPRRTAGWKVRRDGQRKRFKERERVSPCIPRSIAGWKVRGVEREQNLCQFWYSGSSRLDIQD